MMKHKPKDFLGKYVLYKTIHNEYIVLKVNEVKQHINPISYEIESHSLHLIGKYICSKNNYLKSHFKHIGEKSDKIDVSIHPKNEYHIFESYDDFEDFVIINNI